MDVREFVPADDETLVRSLLQLQRAAYAVEAALIGDDRIPPLHEDLEDLRRVPLRWLGAFATDAQLVGALAWSEETGEVDLHRLVVDPATVRRGVGSALVHAGLRHAGGRRTFVATGRANIPARSLYERVGFIPVDDREVVPGLWVTRYVSVPSSDAPR